MKAADERHVAAVPVAEAGQFVRGVAAVAQENELPGRKPADQDGHQLAGQLRWRLVPAALGRVEGFRPVQRCQDRQGPAAPRERKPDRHGQDDPPVPPPPHGQPACGADRVVVTPFAVDLFAAMLGRGIIDDEQDRLGGIEPPQDGLGQDSAERPKGPGGAAEDAMIGTEVAVREGAGAAQHGGDGSAAPGEDGPDGEHQHPPERRLGEGDGKTHQERLRCRWKRKHHGLLSDSLTSYISQNRQESVSCAKDSLSPGSPQKRQKSNSAQHRRRTIAV